MKLTLLAAVASLAFLVTSGCSSVFKYIEPVYDIRGKDVFVVPFDHGNYWHYESREGNRLGQAIELALQKNGAGLKTIRNPAVHRAIRQELSDEVDWLSYGRQVGAEFLIVGTIEKLSYESPQLVGMWQGDIRVRYEVWDLVEGKRGLVQAVEQRVPDNPDSGQVYIGFEQTKGEITTALPARTAQRIARHLCGYEQSGIDDR